MPQTGPTTPEGKQRSSLNALKHGLTATSRHALDEIAREIGVNYATILAELREHYRPADPVEDQLVKRIARCSWRLALSEEMERRLIERQPTMARPGPSYERVMKYERLVDIHLYRAIDALTRKREAERQHPAPGTRHPTPNT